MTQNYVVPSQMIAIEVINPGKQSPLQQVTVAVPELKAGQVLVKVAAAGVNRADLLQRSGLYPPPAGESDILGLEVAGTVVAMADDVSPEWLEQAVFGLVPGGGYAQYVALPAEHLIRKPASLGMAEAAACAEVFLTAFQAMRVVGHLPDQGALLVHAGASGVGTAAIQLGKALGCFVAVTVGSDEKAKACLALGADCAVNYKTHDFAAELKAAFGEVSGIIGVGGGSTLDLAKAVALMTMSLNEILTGNTSFILTRASIALSILISIVR